MVRTHEQVMRPIWDGQAQRFWEKVEGGDVSTCWLWMGSKTRQGYGLSRHGYSTRIAHRWAYEFMVGVVPEGLQLDHLCRNRACVNPWHLDPVTAAVNIRRSIRATATECLRGHPLSGDNLVPRVDKNGYRRRGCRACMKFHAARRTELRKLRNG